MIVLLSCNCCPVGHKYRRRAYVHLDEAVIVAVGAVVHLDRACPCPASRPGGIREREGRCRPARVCADARSAVQVGFSVQIDLVGSQIR